MIMLNLKKHNSKRFKPILSIDHAFPKIEFLFMYELTDSTTFISSHCKYLKHLSIVRFFVYEEMANEAFYLNLKSFVGCH